MKKILIFVFIFILFIIGVLFAVPVLKVQSVVINGNKFLSREAILNDCHIELNKTNMFHINYFTVESEAKKYDPYINTIKVYPISYNALGIDVKEKRPQGYIPYLNSYLCINEDGLVLDITNEPKGSLPLVSGLKFTHISKGEIIKVDNPKVFRILVEIQRLMEKYEMEYDDLTVNISDPEDLHIYVNNLDVILGNTENINQKISTLTEVLKKMNKNDKGFLYLDNLDSEIRFQYLT